MGVGGAPPSGKGVTREGSLANEGTSLRGMDNNFLFLWVCVLHVALAYESIVLYMCECKVLMDTYGYKYNIWKVLEGLFFFLCRGTNIYNFWGCTRISRHVPRLNILFTFSIFLKWILSLLVREKHRKTLYRFLLNKNKEWGKNNKDNNSET